MPPHRSMSRTKGHIVDTRGTPFVPYGIELSIGNDSHRVTRAIDAGLTMPLVINPWINPVSSISSDMMNRFVESLSADPEFNIIAAFDTNIAKELLPEFVAELRRNSFAHIGRLTFRLLDFERMGMHERHIYELERFHSGWVAESWARYLSHNHDDNNYVFESYLSLNYEAFEPSEYGNIIVNIIQNESLRASTFVKQ